MSHLDQAVCWLFSPTDCARRGTEEWQGLQIPCCCVCVRYDGSGCPLVSHGRPTESILYKGGENHTRAWLLQQCASFPLPAVSDDQIRVYRLTGQEEPSFLVRTHWRRWLCPRTFQEILDFMVA